MPYRIKLRPETREVFELEKHKNDKDLFWEIRTRPSFSSWLVDYIERSEQMLIVIAFHSITGKTNPLWRGTFILILTGLWMTLLTLFDWLGLGTMLSCWVSLGLVAALTIYLYYLVDTTKLKRG